MTAAGDDERVVQCRSVNKGANVLFRLTKSVPLSVCMTVTKRAILTSCHEVAGSCVTPFLNARIHSMIIATGGIKAVKHHHPL